MGTTTPATGTTLHIDGAKDNTSATPTATEAANDVVVTSTGKVGIGTATPTNNLDIQFDDTSTVGGVSVRNSNANSRVNYFLNTSGASDVNRNSLGFSLTGSDYINGTPSFSGNNAIIYSTATNGLNLQTHSANSKFKFYNGGLAEAAVSMVVHSKKVGINTTNYNNVSDYEGVLAVGNSATELESLALHSYSSDGINTLSYYDLNHDLDARIGIIDTQPNNFSLRIEDPTKTFSLYLNNSTRMEMNSNGFLRLGRQSGSINSLLTLDGPSGITFQNGVATSTNARIVFDALNASTLGLHFALNNVAHAYTFSTLSTPTAFKILNNGNVGIGTTTPTSKLQVVGLVEYANDTAAGTAGLTAGAFYHTAGVVKVKL